jgi:hypothetical protein
MSSKTDATPAAAIRAATFPQKYFVLRRLVVDRMAMARSRGSQTQMALAA